MPKARKSSKRRSPRQRGTADGTHRPELESIRERIDEIDADLHRLINERAKLAREVGISKHQDGHTVDFYRPEREAQV